MLVSLFYTRALDLWCGVFFLNGSSFACLDSKLDYHAPTRLRISLLRRTFLKLVDDQCCTTVVNLLVHSIARTLRPMLTLAASRSGTPHEAHDGSRSRLWFHQLGGFFFAGFDDTRARIGSDLYMDGPRAKIAVCLWPIGGQCPSTTKT